MSYAAQGGTLKPCGGSEDWSGFAAGSIPTTFAGGTIEGPYGPDNPPFHNAGIDYSFHILYTGLTSVPFRLTFTSPVNSVQMDLQGGSSSAFQTRTLKAYDSSNNLVGTDSPAINAVGTVSVTSPTNTNTIKYFTLEDSDGLGTFVIDIVWSCAA